jgi:hypothetical protein
MTLLDVSTGKQCLSYELKGNYIYMCKGKPIPLQALTGPEGSRRLRLSDFKIIGT